MARKHNVDEVLKSLKRKHDVQINLGSNVVQVLSGKDPRHPKQDDLGNSSWGKIDFLTNYNGFVVVKVDKFDKTL